MLPDERRGRDNPAMTSSGKGSKKCPRKAEREWSWERIAGNCVSDSVTAIGGPRVRHAVLPRGTPNSDGLFPYVPHSRTARAGKNNVRFIGIPYLQLLNNVLMAWARTCGDVSVVSYRQCFALYSKIRIWPLDRILTRRVCYFGLGHRRICFWNSLPLYGAEFYCACGTIPFGS
jgi:hypothetical protein